MSSGPQVGDRCKRTVLRREVDGHVDEWVGGKWKVRWVCKWWDLKDRWMKVWVGTWI